MSGGCLGLWLRGLRGWLDFNGYITKSVNWFWHYSIINMYAFTANTFQTNATPGPNWPTWVSWNLYSWLRALLCCAYQIKFLKLNQRGLTELKSVHWNYFSGVSGGCLGLWLRGLRGWLDSNVYITKSVNWFSQYSILDTYANTFQTIATPGPNWPTRLSWNQLQLSVGGH